MRPLAPATPAVNATRELLPHLPNGSTVTVGSFDGVHLGHQAVLQEIGRRARAAGRASVLVTFDPHPLEVVNPGAAPPLLTTGAERLEILVQSPLDYVLLLRFDRYLAGLTPEGFVRDVLLERCAVRELVIGHDHGFGRGRSGDVETLRQLGAVQGFHGGRGGSSTLTGLRLVPAVRRAMRQRGDRSASPSPRPTPAGPRARRCRARETESR